MRHYLTVLDLASTVPPQRFDSIQRLDLILAIPDAHVEKHFDIYLSNIPASPLTSSDPTVAARTWSVVSTISSLRSLDVTFHGTIGPKSNRKISLLTPLSVVRQTRHFVVSVPWHRQEGEEKVRDVPYVLEWTEERLAHEPEEDVGDGFDGNWREEETGGGGDWRVQLGMNG